MANKRIGDLVAAIKITIMALSWKRMQNYSELRLESLINVLYFIFKTYPIFCNINLTFENNSDFNSCSW